MSFLIYSLKGYVCRIILRSVSWFDMKAEKPSISNYSDLSVFVLNIDRCGTWEALMQ